MNLGEDHLVELVISLDTRDGTSLHLVLPDEASTFGSGGESVNDGRGPVVQPIVAGPAAEAFVEFLDARVERYAGAEIDDEPLVIQDHHPQVVRVDSVVGLSSAHD